jgi:hypothetical protein
VDRIMAAIKYFNDEPVVHTWSFKLDKAAQYDSNFGNDGLRSRLRPKAAISAAVQLGRIVPSHVNARPPAADHRRSSFRRML